jgi:predicted nucleotide-binding protein
MKVFIGSSRESSSAMHTVASWLEDEKHKPMPWDEPAVFRPGDYIFSRLIEISKQVDAAIFVFAEDDKLWYRTDTNTVSQPRDNVLIEYGLFAGISGQERVIVCRKGKPKNPVDLQGIIHVDLSKPQKARQHIKAWIQKIGSQDHNKPSFEDKVKELRKHLINENFFLM